MARENQRERARDRFDSKMANDPVEETRTHRRRAENYITQRVSQLKRSEDGEEHRATSSQSERYDSRKSAKSHLIALHLVFFKL